MSPDFVVERVEREGERVRVLARVPEDLAFFEGHFEDRPMLPGIAQILVLVNRRAREFYGALGAERRIARLKFERTIKPGDVLDLHLERTESGGGTQVRFRIERGGETCTSGALVYAR